MRLKKLLLSERYFDKHYNSAWLKMHGYSSKKEVLGKHFSITQMDSDVEDAQKNVDHLLAGNFIPSGEFTRRCKDGKIGYHTFSANPVLQNDQIVGFEGFIIDITKNKQLEAQLQHSQKMESIGTMAGGIAHDFNNILHMILGNTEMALEDIPEWNPAHDSLKEIKTASLRAAGIVKQLLNFSRKTGEELRPTGIMTVVKESLKLLRSTIPTNIEIRKNIPATDEIILADPIQINQLMMNLCVNASQEMKETGGIIEISMETIMLKKEDISKYPDLTQGKYVKLTISDTGPGINPQNINRIFDPYFTTKEVGEGSGMGLAIVHGIIKNHSGAITVDSQLGKGTAFTLFLPVITGRPSTGDKTGVETPDDELKGNETILFVDDEESIANMTQKILERLGYTVETRLNPLEALELFQSKPDEFDLVITDMAMPQMTGVNLSKKLRNISSDIPIIICTGHSDLIDEDEAEKIGLNAYAMKPIARQDIAKTIRKMLDK